MNQPPLPHVAAPTLVSDVRFELMPVKSAGPAIAQLPPASRVTVTCSPTKGIRATLELSARVRDAGHHVVPHIAARLVRDRSDVTCLAGWLRDHAVAELFVVGGDSSTPAGRYADASSFLRDLLDAAAGDVSRIGVAAYPDGHVDIAGPALRSALQSKQTLLADAGVAGYATTQMCFEPLQIRAWLATERLAGLRMPVYLGVPGVVERRRLLSIGMRVGVGASLRYLRKNTGLLGPLLSPRAARYDPSNLVDAVAPHAAELGIVGVHSFTFALHYDRAISGFMGGPGREAFEATAWFDANVVDGAVNGSGKTVQAVAGVLRKAQSGFVRMYAGIIGLGVAALLAWFVLWRGVL